MPKDKSVSKPPKASAAKPGVPAEAAKAFAEVEPSLAALKPEELAPINTDIPRAVAVAVGAVPHLARLRASAAKLPGFDIAHLDRLGTYALAAWYAHLLALPAVVESELAALLDEARPLRESMLLSSELLAHTGLFDRDAVKAIRAGQGNLDTANDLVALAALFTSGWSQVENKTPIEWAQVERAAQLGPRILIALGARDVPGVPSPGAADPAERRHRAYTLFVTYLRWDEGDADEIAPSLFANRSPRKAAPAAEPVAAPAPEGSADK
jgi:hypothetical protein